MSARDEILNINEVESTPAWLRTPENWRQIDRSDTIAAGSRKYKRNRLELEPLLQTFKATRSLAAKNDLLRWVQNYVRPSIKYDYEQAFSGSEYDGVRFHIGDRVDDLLVLVGNGLEADDFASFGSLLAYLRTALKSNRPKALTLLTQINEGARRAEYGKNGVVTERFKVRVDDDGNETRVDDVLETVSLSCLRWSPEALARLSGLPARDREFVFLLQLHNSNFETLGKMLGWEADSVRRTCDRISTKLEKNRLLN